MNWNDPAFLKSASAVIQWTAIILVFLGGCLQVTKHWVDLREKRISGILTYEKESAQRGREQELRTRLETSEKRIRSLNLELRIDIITDWKEGIPPDPRSWILFGGASQVAHMDLLLDDGRAVPVKFFQAEAITFARSDPQVVELYFRSTAEPGSDVFGILPEQIKAVRQLSFRCFGMSRDKLAGHVAVIGPVRALFFVNGRPTLSVTSSPKLTLDLSQQAENAELYLIRPGDLEVASP